MEDIFQTEMITSGTPENDIRLTLSEVMREELKRRDKKQKKNGKKKSKKKEKKSKKSSEWGKIAISSVQAIIEYGIPALFRKWESRT